MKRFVLFSFIGVILAFSALPFGVAAASGISGHGTSTVLTSQGQPDYALGVNGTIVKALPVSADAATHYTSITNEIETNSKTVNNTTTFSYSYLSENVLFTNATSLELNDHSVNKVSLNLKIKGNATVDLGLGNLITNTSYTFSPILQNSVSAKNDTANTSFVLSAADLTGNGSTVLMVQINFANATANSLYSVSVNLTGTSGSSPWYLAGESAAYLFGGGILFIAGFMVLPFHDFTITKMTAPVTKHKAKKATSKKNTKKTSKKGGK